CGEMAGRPLIALALLGLGFTRISMTPSAIGPIKAMLLDVDVQNLQEQLLEELSKPHIKSLHNWMQWYAQEHAISV
ncbi:MAG: peptidase, partial [Bartonella sp.]|nr:peptidase [Bartonella sp.]